MNNPFYSGRIPPTLFKAIDEYRKSSGESKTELLVNALAKYINFELDENKPVIPPIQETLIEHNQRIEYLEQQLSKLTTQLENQDNKLDSQTTVNKDDFINKFDSNKISNLESITSNDNKIITDDNKLSNDDSGGSDNKVITSDKNRYRVNDNLVITSDNQNNREVTDNADNITIKAIQDVKVLNDNKTENQGEDKEIQVLSSNGVKELVGTSSSTLSKIKSNNSKSRELKGYLIKFKHSKGKRDYWSVAKLDN